MSSRSTVPVLLALAFAALPAPTIAAAALGPSWTVGVGTQQVRVENDGTFLVPNITFVDRDGDTVADRLTRVIGTSTIDGATYYAVSDPFRLRAGALVTVEQVRVSGSPPLRVAALRAQASAAVLTAIGQQVQVLVTGVMSDGSLRPLHGEAEGTTYSSSNPNIVSVDAAGTARAAAAGDAFITVENDGALTTLPLSVVPGATTTSVEGLVRLGGVPAAGSRVVVLGTGSATLTTDAAGRFFQGGLGATAPLLVFAARTTVPSRVAMLRALEPVPGGATDAGLLELQDICVILGGACVDSDQDAVPDDRERDTDTEPDDADSDNDGLLDGLEDEDGDGLPNALEIVLGSDPDGTDTDRDGRSDRDELRDGTDPGRRDTDGDGLRDGDERAAGTDPLAPDVLPPSLVRLAAPVAGTVIEPGRILTLRAEAQDDGRVARVEFRVDGVTAFATTAAACPPSAPGCGRHEGSVRLFPQPGQVAIEVVAFDTAGNSRSSGPAFFTVGPPGVVLVRGVVLDEALAPVAGATVSAPGASTLSLADGSFEMLAPVADEMFVRAERAAPLERGRSLSFMPEPFGDVDVGDVVVSALAPDYPVSAHALLGQGASAVVLVDADEDGFPDAVALASFDNALVMRRGLGNGDLGPQAIFGTVAFPTALATGDVDGDGHADMVVAGDFGELATHRGNGAGSFGGPVVSAAPRLEVLSLADLDGDGRLDAVAPVRFASSVAVAFGAGDGTFGTATQLAVGMAPSDLLVGDVDGDQDPDLVVVSRAQQQVRIVRNAGSRSFQSLALVTSPNFPVGGALGDVDGDGDVDLVTGGGASTGQNTCTFRGDGTGALAAASCVGTGPGFARPLRLLDVTDDGILDLVSFGRGVSDSDLVVREGVGGGSFGRVTQAATVLDPVDLAVADLDQDGNPDAVACGRLLGQLAVHVAEGARPFRGTVPSAQSRIASPERAFVAELNADGIPDLVMQARTAIGTELGRGDGTFNPEQAHDYLTEAMPLSEPTGMAVADVTGDGATDVVVTLFVGGSPNGTLVVVLPGRGDGTFMTARVALELPLVAHGVAAGDLDGDGDADLVLAADADVIVSLGAGGGAFSLPMSFPGTLSSFSTIELADMTGDDVTDVLRWENRVVAVSPGLGGGMLGAEILTEFDALSQNSSFSSAGVALEDMDGDGDLDMLRAAADRLGLARGDGLGSFTSEQVLSIAVSGEDGTVQVFARDVTGDGVPDGIVGQASGVLVLANDGAGTLTPRGRHPAGLTFFGGDSQCVMTDADLDGLLDVVVLRTQGDATLRHE